MDAFCRSRLEASINRIRLLQFVEVVMNCVLNIKLLAGGPDSVRSCEPAISRCPEPNGEPGEQIQQGQKTGQRVSEQVCRTCSNFLVTETSAQDKCS